MMTEAADQDTDPDTDEPAFRYADKRLMISWHELNAANAALRDLLTEYGVKPDPQKYAQVPPLDLTMSFGSGTGSRQADEARVAVITAILRAINFKRLGYAEGTIAKHKDGRVAKRYYDKVFCCLRWIILQNEQANPNVERLDELPDGWTIVHDEPWKVSVPTGEDPPI